jgi:glycosyltransferase involved in cell wall biosynthesis
MSSPVTAQSHVSPPKDVAAGGRAKARVLEVASYPPPRSGWSVRVEFLKKRIEAEGHQCVVLNVGPSRNIPSPEYDSVRNGPDLVRKLWRYSSNGFVVHAHTNGDSIKGALLALGALLVNLIRGQRGYLTFHAGAIQRYFPRHRAWALAPLYWLLFLIPRGVICNSEPVRQLIRGYGISSRKIAAIPAFSRQYLDFTPVPLPNALEDFFRRFPHVVFTYARMRPLFYPLTMIDGMARVMERRHDVGLVLCGGLSHMEEGLWKEVDGRIQARGISDRILLIDDLDREAFLTALQRSSLYLRTPITDGVASSVLESLALGVPVVASENGTRPPGVVTYPPEDAGALAAGVEQVVANRPAAVDRIGQVEIADTLAQEVALLTGTAARTGAS